MELSWIQSIMYSLIMGVMDIFPVSAQAHHVLMVKLFGKTGSMELLQMLIHLAVLGGLLFSNQSELSRFSRARALARIPKRKRRRPLDTRSLMDLSMLKTMAVPVVIGFFFYNRTTPWGNHLVTLSALLLVNGLILYIPQFLPGSNRDARTLTPIEGLLMGLGGGLSVLPGISAVGAAVSIGSVCGVERKYCLNMALLMNLLVMVGKLVFDVAVLTEIGMGSITFLIFLRYLVCAVIAFLSSVLAIKLMRFLAANFGYALFGLYSVGLALFTFILNLMA